VPFLAAYTRIDIGSGARRAIPGIGYKIDRELRDMGVATVADVVATPRPTLLQRFGERSGHFLYLACRAKVTAALAWVDDTHICSECRLYYTQASPAALANMLPWSFVSLRWYCFCVNQPLTSMTLFLCD